MQTTIILCLLVIIASLGYTIYKMGKRFEKTDGALLIDLENGDKPIVRFEIPGLDDTLLSGKPQYDYVVLRVRTDVDLTK